MSHLKLQKKATEYNRPNLHWVCGSTDPCNSCPLGPSAKGDCQGKSNCKPKRSLRSKRQVFTISVTIFFVGVLFIGMARPWKNEFLAPGDLTSAHARMLSQDELKNGESRCSYCHDEASGLSSWISLAFSGSGAPQSEKCMQCHEASIDQELALAAHNQPAEKLNLITKELAQKNGIPLSSASYHQSETACSACHREHHGAEFNLSQLTDQQCQTCHTQSFDSFATDHPTFDNWPFSNRNQIAFSHVSHMGNHFPEAKTVFDCNSCHVADENLEVMKVASFEKACASCHQQKVEISVNSGLTFISLPILDVDALAASGNKIGQWPERASGDFDGVIPPIMKALLYADPKVAKALDHFGEDFDFYDVETDNQKDMRAAAEIAWGIKRLMNDLSIESGGTITKRIGTQLSIANLAKEQKLGTIPRTLMDDAIRSWFPNLKSELADPTMALSPASQNRLKKMVSLIFSPSVKTVAFWQDIESKILAENPLAGFKSKTIPQQSPKRYTIGSTPDPVTYPSKQEVQAETKIPTVEQDLPKPNLENSLELTENPLRKYRPDISLLPKDSTSLVSNPSTPNPAKDKAATPRTTETEQNPSTPELVQNGSNVPANTPENVPNNFPSSIPKANQDGSELLVPNPLAGTRPQNSLTQKNADPANSTDPANKTDQPKTSPSVAGPKKTDPIVAQSDKPKPETLPEDPVTNQVTQANRPPSKVPTTSSSPKSSSSKSSNSLIEFPGQWLRDDSLNSIVYQPIGHQDPLIQKWIDTLASDSQSSNRSSTKAIHQQFISGENPVGNCTSCHSLDDNPLEPETKLVNWNVGYRTTNIRQFTKFSHRPHLVENSGKDCQSCHEINKEVKVAENYALANYLRGVTKCQSEFHPISKDNCASCHKFNGASQSCTQCHNYHVGSPVSRK